MDINIILTCLIFLPVIVGFLGCLLPNKFFFVGVFTLLINSFLSLFGLLNGFNNSFTLINQGGILLSFDEFSLPLIFGTSVVFLITFSLRRKYFSHYFYQISLVLCSALSICFISKDLISIYIALELTGFCAFLLIADKNTDKSLFQSFQYLIGGGLAMLIYLIGVIQAFTYTGSFALDDLSLAPSTALCLIVAGLLTKSGIFLCGIWVPNIYTNASIQTSSILSGCVTCAGIAPISRMSQILIPISNSMIVIGVLSAILAAILAIFETDDGRTLGWSSVSQLGISILSPSYACLYVMQHGICKCLLFNTHNDNSDEKISNQRGTNDISILYCQDLIRLITFIIASLSITGFPFIAGFTTKTLLKYDLPPSAQLIVSTSALLTSAIYVKLIISNLNRFRRTYYKKIPSISIRSFISNDNFIFILCIILLISSSFLRSDLLKSIYFTNSLSALFIGGIFYLCVMGIEKNIESSNIRKTIDIIGAPFIVAAFLLANLTYFKL